MSASNWQVCPRCLEKALADKAAAQERARAAYGVQPVEEFDRLRALGDQPIDLESLTTLREDWDIGIYFVNSLEDANTTSSAAKFSSHYKGYCSTCGFTYTHKFEESAWPPEGERDGRS